MLVLASGCAQAPSLEGGCALAPDNALRATCTFEGASGPVELAFDPPGPVVDGAHVRRLRADTTYTWTARAGEDELIGELATGPLPPAVDLEVEHTGADHPDDVMFLVNCPDGDLTRPAAVAIDGAGRIVWYQELAADLPPSDDPVVGLTWSLDGTVLVVPDRQRIREFDLDGRLVSDLVVADGVEKVVHHDVFRRDGLTWAITARLQGEFIVDGVSAFDAQGVEVVDWDLSRVATPSGEGSFGGIYWVDTFPGGLDWAHANGVWVAEDGDFLLSLHTFSTVIRVDSASGALRWVLDGSGTSPWPSTFAVTDPEDRTDDEVFGHQHHPVELDGGVLQFFDNGDGFADPARALRLRLDEAAGTAEIAGSWALPDVCPIEGSVFELSNGDLLATCSLLSTFHQLDAATGAIEGSTTATCAGPELELLPRAIPVDLR